MLAAKRWTSVVLQIILRHSWQACNEACKKGDPGFEPRADVIRSPKQKNNSLLKLKEFFFQAQAEVQHWDVS